MTEPPKMVPSKPDAEFAADIRARLTEAIKPALAIMDEAIAAGLVVNFQIGATPPLGKHALNNLSIVRPL
jgi:hypothetical protein